MAKKFKQLPKYQRYLALMLGFYLCYALLAGLLLPYISYQYIPDKINQLTDREVKYIIKNVKFFFNKTIKKEK